ncbi:hypothetical protein [Polaribacter sp. IC063]|uniref:hypothetical protein n=1 Tax=Polaribacter sp. IC063 TaxID=57031 RepID=UPI0011BD6061|nr:hypothetical protein [Polaribacter sp. IC063]TXD53927.1 hypothetical protein ES043_02550 [Polaribacter sp. IC063]
MEKLYNYINNIFIVRREENILEFIDDQFNLQIVFNKKIKEGEISLVFLKKNIKEIVINRYKKENEDIVDELFFILNRFYIQTNNIPNYTLKNNIEAPSKIFYKIYLPIENNIEENTLDLISIFSETKNRDIHKKFIKETNYLLKESRQIEIIQTNTKTRRLGYLNLIITLFENSTYFPVSYLEKKIETISSSYNEDLLDYGISNKGDDKGLIKLTRNGSSSKPYVRLLEELNLLTQINNSYILTKQSKIYFHLNKDQKKKNELKNIFKLNELDKLFLLRQILISDTLYIWAIIDIMFIIQEPIDTMSIKKLFVNYIKNDLNIIQHNTNNNLVKKKNLELKKRISSWEKPIVYLEHIIEPRINWLLDLDIVILNNDAKSKRYVLTKAGMNLFYKLSSVFGRNSSKELVLASYFEQNYFDSFNFIFELNKTSEILDKLKIEKYLLEAFKIFKTNAPNRIAASQGIDYVCFKSFLEDGVIIEFEELKKYLQEKNNKFSLDWFNTENDGTLYLR